MVKIEFSLGGEVLRLEQTLRLALTPKDFMARSSKILWSSTANSTFFNPEQHKSACSTSFSVNKQQVLFA